MADATYNPGGTGIRREQGGRVLAVGSTGQVDYESGSYLNLQDGARMSVPVTIQTTTSGTITNFGMTTFGTTIASAYTLANPDYAGQIKILACTISGATTVLQTVTTASTACTIAGTSDGATVVNRVLTFHEAGEVVVLVSRSSTAWVIVSNVNGVSLST